MPFHGQRCGPTGSARFARLGAALAGVIVVGCAPERTDAGHAPPATRTSADDHAAGAGNVEALRHDFGTLRHGEVEHHTFVIPLPDDGRAYVPLGYARNCVCASHEFAIVAVDGTERYPTGQPLAGFAVQADERLELRLRLDTGEKEAADLPPTVIPGEVVVRDLGMVPNELRIPVRFQFAIMTPVAITPAAAIDFGRMPRSVRFARTYRFQSREGPTKFGPVRCFERSPTNPSIEVEFMEAEVELRQGEDPEQAELTIAFRPAADRPYGPLAFRVEIDTALPPTVQPVGDSAAGPTTDAPPSHYVIRMPASAFVIPDIELGPPGKIAFGQIDISQSHRAQLIVTDHDPARAPEFFVVGVVDEAGADASQHFEASIESVPEHPRSRAIIVSYDGGLADQSYFRGHVNLSKSAGGPIVQQIEYSAFRRR